MVWTGLEKELILCKKEREKGGNCGNELKREITKGTNDEGKAVGCKGKCT
jgi:hypothetical protein